MHDIICLRGAGGGAGRACVHACTEHWRMGGWAIARRRLGRVFRLGTVCQSGYMPRGLFYGERWSSTCCLSGWACAAARAALDGHRRTLAAARHRTPTCMRRSDGECVRKRARPRAQGRQCPTPAQHDAIHRSSCSPRNIVLQECIHARRTSTQRARRAENCLLHQFPC